jgi:hypothetical protein
LANKVRGPNRKHDVATNNNTVLNNTQLESWWKQFTALSVAIVGYLNAANIDIKSVGGGGAVAATAAKF